MALLPSAFNFSCRLGPPEIGSLRPKPKTPSYKPAHLRPARPAQDRSRRAVRSPSSASKKGCLGTSQDSKTRRFGAVRALWAVRMKANPTAASLWESRPKPRTHYRLTWPTRAYTYVLGCAYSKPALATGRNGPKYDLASTRSMNSGREITSSDDYTCWPSSQTSVGSCSGPEASAKANEKKKNARATLLQCPCAP